MAQNEVPNHLVMAILVTIFCCLPLGIVSIINAAKVNDLVAAGDMDAAVTASANAKKWATYGIIIGVVATIGMIVFQVIFGLAAVSAS